jgi:hypothetical protein
MALGPHFKLATHRAEEGPQALDSASGRARGGSGRASGGRHRSVRAAGIRKEGGRRRPLKEQNRDAEEEENARLGTAAKGRRPGKKRREGKTGM